MDQIGDDVLLNAIRERLLNEIKSKRDAQSIVNNVYGGPGERGPEMNGGIHGGMAGEAQAPEDRDYFVDILRENLDPQDPSKGWKKSVHRHTKKKVNPPAPVG